MQEHYSWSDAARSVWGKTDPRSGESLPLVRHLEDSATVAGYLWDHWLPPLIKRTIAEGLPRELEDGRTLVCLEAGLHDIGKASPAFAIKASARFNAQSGGEFDHLVSGMERYGLVCPPYGRGDTLPPHCRVGQFVLTGLLVERGMSSQVARGYASPVGTHHGSAPSKIDLQNLRGDRWMGRRQPAWDEVQREIFEGMLTEVGAADRIGEWIRQPLSQHVQVLLTAVVVVADWLASDSERFRYDDPRPAQARLEDAGLDEALAPPWRAGDVPEDVEALLGERFPQLWGAKPRPLQLGAVDLANTVNGPALMVMEAPMGVGKTEAALLAAEVVAQRLGAGGLFIGLPTMATSDAMFGRVHAWAQHTVKDDDLSAYLAHGKATLNDEFRGLASRSRPVDVDSFTDESPKPGELNGGEVVATSWLRGRRKGVLADLVVGTIDQALFAGLRMKHLPLRHLALAGKVVVLDEVHAADAYMRRYLVRVLEWLGAYGAPVILLSATLPPAVRRELVGAYARGAGLPVPVLLDDDAYPRITMQTGTGTREVAVGYDGVEQSIEVELLLDDLGTLVERVTAAVQARACVGVIRNTVDRAIEAYDELRHGLGDDRIMLVHSRFVASDRVRKENDVRRLLGPPPGPDGASSQRPDGIVVVGTQVLEQSLDIDFDLLVTDIAPADLVLQRAGRLHRHRRGAGESLRPKGFRAPRLLLTGVCSWSEPPEFDSGVDAVYGQHSLLRSAAVLRPHIVGHAPLLLPRDIAPLVRAAYDPELGIPPGWEDTWRSAATEATQQEADQRERAKVFRVAEPNSDVSLVGWLDYRAEEEDSKGRAQVRDSEDGIEVVVVWRHEGLIRTLPSLEHPLGEDVGLPSVAPPVTARIAREIAASTVRLPQWMCRAGVVDRVIQDLEQSGDWTGWQQSAWLKGQLVLLLDSDRRAEIAGVPIRYSADRGLMVEGKVHHD